MSVCLVGAGPGDPELITVRGLELVRRCDVLVYDALVSPLLVDESPPGAERIARERLRQEEVNHLLVDRGRRGFVVRLKGGDPLVFGRGGEEALALAAAGVPFEIVPGVSSLTASAAAAGAPLTHRGVADSVTIVTGRSASGGPPDYERLAAVGGTLAIFMGRERADEIAAGLIAAGLAPSTPAAVVSRATWPDETARTTTLAGLPHVAEGSLGPALILVGDVMRIAAQVRAAVTPAAA